MAGSAQFDRFSRCDVFWGHPVIPRTHAAYEGLRYTAARGAENVGVENTGAITQRKLSEEKTIWGDSDVLLTTTVSVTILSVHRVAAV